MKTLRNIFGNDETKKSMDNFSTELDLNAMLMIKGGDGDNDDDLWPPTVPPGNN